MHELEPVLERLERLERESRRWKRAALLTALSFAGVLATGFARPDPTTIEAQRFVLKDAGGRVVGDWKIGADGNPMLLLERDRASALLTLAGPALDLRGSDGKRGAFLGVDSRGDARLEVRSERYLDGVRVVSKADGSSGVYLLDGQGNERSGTELGADGQVLFSARDTGRNVRCEFGMDAKGLPNLLLFDRAGGRRLGMLVNDVADGRPLLALEDGQGNTRAELTIDRDGSPNLTMRRPDGSKSFQAP